MPYYKFYKEEELEKLTRKELIDIIISLDETVFEMMQEIEKLTE